MAQRALRPSRDSGGPPGPRTVRAPPQPSLRHRRNLDCGAKTGFRLCCTPLPQSARRGLFSMGKINRAKLLIIGSGAAGHTAAIYAARAMLEPILIQGIQPGGQLTITTDVENYPGFADVIQGPWLMEQMQKQAEHVGTNLVAGHVSRVDLGRRPFRIDCDSGDHYLADSVIIATGAQARWLNLPSEQKFKGYG